MVDEASKHLVPRLEDKRHIDARLREGSGVSSGERGKRLKAGSVRRSPAYRFEALRDSKRHISAVWGKTERDVRLALWDRTARWCDLVAYGGNAEDVVLMRAFGDRPGGFFVDVGAGAPVQGSLTKNLVDRLGWRGVNIEPLPEGFESLRAARPGDVTPDVAIGEQPGPECFFRIVPGAGEDRWRWPGHAATGCVGAAPCRWMAL